MSKPKIAIVHDYLNQYGGAEKVLEAISEVFPQAPIYTSIYDKGKLRNLGFEGDSKKIITGFTQKLPFRNILPRYYLTPFYPFVFLSFDFSNYDIIISSSSFAAKYLRKKKAVHICYCHTPPRFLWGFDTDININSMRFFERPIAKAAQKILRKLDFYMAQKVDLFLTNSENVKKRIEKVYSRDSKVVYPPIDTDRFDLKKAKIGDYFLIVSRLGEYKKIDIVAGIESRGFIIAGILADKLNVGMVPIRKKGKLPHDTIRQDYALEYGMDTIEIHSDAIQPGNNVLLIDDLIATGGTARAAAQLIEKLGWKIEEISFIVELPDLLGREKLKPWPVFSIINFEENR